jgi:hypothetical protein
MAKSTHNKLLFLLFTYSIVLLHAIIPHCHAADAHAVFQTEKTATHTCEGHHHHDHDADDSSHEHQVCQSDDLHGQYLKADASSIDFDVLLTDTVELWSFVIYDFNENINFASVQSDAFVRSCILDSNIHRGPPAC